MKRLLPVAVSFCLAVTILSARATPPPPRNVLVVTLDGVRWQELFGGAQSELIDEKLGGVADLDATRKRFERPNADEARRALMPFLWTTVASKGQVFGDGTRHSEARVTNGLWFSYPGYNEMLGGHADPRSTATTRSPTRTSPYSSG